MFPSFGVGGGEIILVRLSFGVSERWLRLSHPFFDQVFGSRCNFERSSWLMAGALFPLPVLCLHRKPHDLLDYLYRSCCLFFFCCPFWFLCEQVMVTSPSSY